MLKRILLLAIFLSFAYASTLPAAVPPMMNFQGILTNASGSPLVSTSRSVQFTIYDAAVAGAVQWAETLTVNTDASGRFNTILGQVHPLTDAVFSDTIRYLGLTVATDPELAPRSRIVSVGYANRISTVDGASGGTIGTSAAQGDVFLEDGAGPGGLVLSGNLFGFYGGSVSSLDPAGSGIHVAALRAGFSGGGGDVYVYDPNTGSYLYLQGNYANTGDGNLEGTGSGSSFSLNTNFTGNAAVSLTTNAISAPEMLDEPGVAGNSFDGYVPTGSYTPMLSRTITSPASGYVLAVASCEWQGSHTSGTTDQNNAGLSSSSSTLPSDQELTVYVNSALPSGLYLEQLASVELFPVGAGAFTVYYNCINFTGTPGAFFDINLELVYLPTSYGTVLASAQAGQPATASTGTPNQSVAATPTVSLEEERVQSIADNNARIENELATMKVQLEKLQAQFKEQAEKIQQGTPKLEQKQ